MFSFKMVWTTILLVLVVNIQFAYSRDFLLKVKSDAPAIKGSVVTFTADLLEVNGSKAIVGDSSFKWEWLIDGHEKQEFRTTVPHAVWTYQFPRQSNKNLNKTYKMDVSVGSSFLLFWYPMASAQLEINVTSMLNGELKLMQNDKHVKPTNIATGTMLDQRLEIRPADLASIKNASSTVVHWFIDCHYVRETKELNTQEVFTNSNETHRIEALIEASFEPLPTKSVPTLTSKLISNWRTQHKSDMPFVCNNKSQVAADPNKVYGYFATNVTVYDAISDLVVNGSTWINDGDDYQLNIYCSGSPKFDYCLRQIEGPYILDGNETCDDWITIDECQQNLTFSQSVLNVKSFTVLVVVRNPVSVERKLFIVNIKQPVIFIATVVGVVVFILCIIAVVAFFLLRFIHKKRSIKRKSVRSDAETTLIGQNPNKVSEAKRIPNKNHL